MDAERFEKVFVAENTKTGEKNIGSKTWSKNEHILEEKKRGKEEPEQEKSTIGKHEYAS